MGFASCAVVTAERIACDACDVRATVWVDAWQMQCCGEPFAIGDEVVWTLSADEDTGWLQNVLGPGQAERIRYVQEHHGGLPDDAPITRGTVVGIRSLHCRYRPASDGDGGTVYPMPGTGRLQQVRAADGWDAESSEVRFLGYLVDLDLSR